MLTTVNRRFMLYLPLADARQAIQSLTLQAEHARSLRDFEKVGTIADKLMEITNPLGLDAIAVYYATLAGNRGGQGSASSVPIFETLTKCPLPVVRARAQLALGSEAFIRGDYHAALERYESAAGLFRSTSLDVVGSFHLATMQAVLVGAMGDHHQALLQLVNLQKVTKATKLSVPVLEYTLMNAIAVELNSIGEFRKAMLLINQVVAAPVSVYYPEWRQSKEEIGASVPVLVSPCSMVRKRAESMRVRAVQMRTAARTQQEHTLSLQRRFEAGGNISTLADHRARRARAVSDKVKLQIFEALLCAGTLTEQVGSDVLSLISA